MENKFLYIFLHTFNHKDSNRYKPFLNLVNINNTNNVSSSVRSLLFLISDNDTLISLRDSITVCLSSELISSVFETYLSIPGVSSKKS